MIEILDTEPFRSSLAAGDTPGAQIAFRTSPDVNFAPGGGTAESDNLALLLRDFLDAAAAIESETPHTIELYEDFLQFDPDGEGHVDVSYCVTRQEIENPDRRTYDTVRVEAESLVEDLLGAVSTVVNLVDTHEYPVSQKEWYGEVNSSLEERLQE